jgi:hypothetical protein
MSPARTWWLCCFLAVCAPLQAATRVALIGGRGHQEAEQCLALAEADLSGGSDIALVERHEIGQLLAEEELSLSGMVDAATAIRAGKLLSADVLAVVETDPQSSRALGILAFETASGVHLCDMALAEGDPEQAGRQIARAVRLAVRKRALGPGARRAFCLVSVRNADLPLSAQPLCDGVGRLVERALTNSPDIVVLERKRFELIKQEATLQRLDQEAAEMKLLAAVLAAEIEVRRGSGEEIWAGATITTVGGKPLGTVRAKADYHDPLLLAEGLGPQLAATMKAAPAAGMTNHRQEAGRFAREALFWRRHRQLPQAMTSLEAALAIDPQSVRVLETATEICFWAAGETLEPGRLLLPPRKIQVRRETLADSLSLAERGMKMAETVVGRHAAEQRPVLAQLLNPVANVDGSFRIQEPLGGMSLIELYLERLPLIEGQHAGDGPRLAALQQRYRALCKALDARARAEVRDRPSFIRYTKWLSVLLRNVELFSPTAKDWGDDTAAFLDAWLEPAGRYGVCQNEFLTPNTMITAIANRTAQLDRVRLTGQWVLTSSDADRLLAVLAKMAAQRRKAVSVLGQAALFMGDVHWRQPVEDDVAEGFKKLRGQVEEAICDPGPDDPRETRVTCYYALLDSIESLPNAADRRGRFRELLDYMLGRGEVVYGAAVAASEPAHVAYDYYAPYLYRTLGWRRRRVAAAAEYDSLAGTARRVLEQLDKQGTVCLDGQEGRLRYRLTDACQAMFLARPELRPKTPAPWHRAVRLLGVTDYPELRAISRVQVRGRTVWTMGLGDGELRNAADSGMWGWGPRGTSDKSLLRSQDGGRNLDGLLRSQDRGQMLAERPYRYGVLQPIAVDLDSAERRVLPKRSYRRESVGAAILPYADNCAFDMDDHELCLGSFSQGLCFVPLQGGPIEWLQYDGQEAAERRPPPGEDVVYHRHDAYDDEILPSPRVLSLAVQDGKAFASLGGFSGRGSFLVSVRLDTHKVRVISSSRGARQQTPLDGLAEPPLIFLPFVKDPARGRLLFAVSHPLSHSGLWELDTRTEKIRRLTASQHYIHWISGNRAGRVLVALANADCSQWQAVEYDLAGDRLEPLYSSQAAAAIDGLKPGTRSIVVPGWPAQPPYLRVGDALWTGWPFGCIQRGGAAGVVFPPLEDKPELLLKSVGLEHEFNWRTMEPLDDGRILVSDRHGIWLVTP